AALKCRAGASIDRRPAVRRGLARSGHRDMAELGATRARRAILFRFAILAALLAMPSTAGSQGAIPVSASDSVERVLATLRASYDSAFAGLMPSLPPEAQDSTSDLWPLWRIGQFRAQAVRWVRMDGDRYIALEGGPLMPAWMVVVPPGSAA